MQVTPWQVQPSEYVLLAICRGGRTELLEFSRTWLESGGSLDLLAAPLTNQVAESATGPAAADAVSARLIWVGNPPSSFLVYWLLHRPGWELYYRKKTERELTQEPPSEPSPAGCYLPWGYEVREAVNADGTITLLKSDGAQLLAQPKSLEHFFTLGQLPTLVPMTADRKNGLAAPAGESPHTPPVTYFLPVHLRPIDRRRPPNPEADMERWQLEINRLQEQLEAHRWYCEKLEAPVWLQVYTESEHRGTPGSAWSLREWFVRAPDAALAQFQHARLEFPEPLGVLHFVLPERLDQEVTVNPPPGKWSLVLDWRWLRLDRRLRLFVPEGAEMWPPPPRNNTHLARLLRNSLWGQADHPPTLVAIRHPDANGKEIEYLLRVPQFAPLRGQLEQLNIDVVFTKLASSVEKTYPKLLREIEKNTETSLQNHVLSLKAELDSLWSGDLANLNRYEEQVREAHEEVRTIRRWKQNIDDFRDQIWRTWCEFRQAVLERDRTLLPTGAGLTDKLSTMDELRSRLANLWRKDTRGERKQLADALRTLAQELEK